MEIVKGMQILLDRALRRKNEQFVNGTYELPTKEVNAAVIAALLEVDRAEWETVARLLHMPPTWIEEAYDALSKFDFNHDVFTIVFRGSPDWPISRQENEDWVQVVAAHHRNAFGQPQVDPIYADIHNAFFMFIPHDSDEQEITNIVRCYHRGVYGAGNNDDTTVTIQTNMKGNEISILKPQLHVPSRIIQTTFYNMPSFAFDLDGRVMDTYVSTSNGEYFDHDYDTFPGDASAP